MDLITSYVLRERCARAFPAFVFRADNNQIVGARRGLVQNLPDRLALTDDDARLQAIELKIVCLCLECAAQRFFVCRPFRDPKQSRLRAGAPGQDPAQLRGLIGRGQSIAANQNAHDA